MVTPLEIAAIIGAVTGSVSLGVIIYKTWREKPKLSINVEDAYHFPPLNESYNFREFSISLVVNNRGTRSTTIHTSNLSFIFEGKTFNSISQGTYFIRPDSSEKISIHFQIRKEEFSQNKNIDNGVLELIHTHGTEPIQLSQIRSMK